MTATTYQRHAIASLDEVIPEIMAKWDMPRPDRFTLISGHSIGISSLRMKTFCRAAYKGKLACVSCGLEGRFFGVETFSRGNQTMPHANLYGVKDGEEILFTHDHILARALGGSDDLDNSQVMCSPCNSHKSIAEGQEARQRRLTKLK